MSSLTPHLGHSYQASADHRVSSKLTADLTKDSPASNVYGSTVEDVVQVQRSKTEGWGDAQWVVLQA